MNTSTRRDFLKSTSIAALGSLAGIKIAVHDEIYWGFRVQPDVTPLLTTTQPRSGKPLAWTRMQNKSRIFYLQLGHDHRAYENPNYRQLVDAALLKFKVSHRMKKYGNDSRKIIDG